MGEAQPLRKSEQRYRVGGLPALTLPVWILTVGRLLSQVGNGFTMFTAPIFFSGQLGLSSSLIGLGLGLGNLAGVLGRWLSGSLSDHPRWGRRPMLLASAAVSAVADLAFALSQGWPLFFVGNLLMGFGIGLYWPAMEAALADRTTLDERNSAFALSRLADNLGLGIGVLIGGALMTTAVPYQRLFVADGVSYIIFGALVWLYIRETVHRIGAKDSGSPAKDESRVASEKQRIKADPKPGWRIALGDQTLLLFLLLNVAFTIYLSQVQTMLPLFLSEFLPMPEIVLSPGFISSLFTVYVLLMAATQMPVVRWLGDRSHCQSLKISNQIWMAGLAALMLLGIVPIASALGVQVWTLSCLVVFAIATVTYLPSASAFVVELAPDSLRGTYLSLNSQCWAIGYFLGSSLGGWALDLLQRQAYWLWGFVALLGIGIHWGLGQLEKQQQLEKKL